MTRRFTLIATGDGGDKLAFALLATAGARATLIGNVDRGLKAMFVLRINHYCPSASKAIISSSDGPASAAPIGAAPGGGA